MFGDPLMTLDYVSTMYLGENKDGYPQRKCAEIFLWLMGRMAAKMTYLYYESISELFIVFWSK